MTQQTESVQAVKWKNGRGEGVDLPVRSGGQAAAIAASGWDGRSRGSKTLAVCEM